MMEVLEFLRKIPKGKVVTYSFLGKKFGIHPRKVGRILSSNEHPDIYPCYKVVMSDRRVGGYIFGAEEKVKRLREEGIRVEGGKVGREFIWEG